MRFGPVVALLLIAGCERHYCSQKNACLQLLKEIEGAKDAWALDQHKTTNDTPSDQDLFGKGRYLPEKPKCPNRGRYIIGRVGEHAVCSNTNHWTIP
jgi:general secretion pathway protein G